MERERGKERERERETRRVYRNNPYKDIKQAEKRKRRLSSSGVQMLDAYSEVSNHQIIPLKTQSLQASINLVLKIKLKIDCVNRKP